MLTEKDYKLAPGEITTSEAKQKLNLFFIAALDRENKAREKFFEFAGYLSEHRLIDADEVGAINLMYLRLQEND